eukprot:3766784-Amphidinium_carterae.1
MPERIRDLEEAVNALCLCEDCRVCRSLPQHFHPITHTLHKPHAFILLGGWLYGLACAFGLTCVLHAEEEYDGDADDDNDDVAEEEDDDDDMMMTMMMTMMMMMMTMMLMMLMTRKTDVPSICSAHDNYMYTSS